MAAVVGTVRVLAIPAGRKGDNRAYPPLTEPRRQGLAVRGRAVDMATIPSLRHTPMTHLGIAPR